MRHFFRYSLLSLWGLEDAVEVEHQVSLIGLTRDLQLVLTCQLQWQVHTTLVVVVCGGDAFLVWLRVTLFSREERPDPTEHSYVSSNLLELIVQLTSQFRLHAVGSQELFILALPVGVRAHNSCLLLFLLNTILSSLCLLSTFWSSIEPLLHKLTNSSLKGQNDPGQVLRLRIKDLVNIRWVLPILNATFHLLCAQWRFSQVRGQVIRIDLKSMQNKGQTGSHVSQLLLIPLRLFEVPLLLVKLDLVPGDRHAGHLILHLFQPLLKWLTLLTQCIFVEGGEVLKVTLEGR